MTKTYYIFRHGETYFSKRDIPYGDKVETAEILPEFIPTVEKLAEYLKDKIGTANYSSPFLRCRQTTEIVTRITGKEFITDQRIGEELLTHGRETYEEMVSRFSDFVSEMEINSDEVITICTHGWPISILTNLITKGEMKKEWLDNIIKPGELIIIKDGKVEIKSFR